VMGSLRNAGARRGLPSPSPRGLLRQMVELFEAVQEPSIQTKRRPDLRHHLPAKFGPPLCGLIMFPNERERDVPSPGCGVRA
jgi:hypothetical protein